MQASKIEMKDGTTVNLVDSRITDANATKLNDLANGSIGSSTQPVYLSDGAITTCEEGILPEKTFSATESIVYGYKLGHQTVTGSAATAISFIFTTFSPWDNQQQRSYHAEVTFRDDVIRQHLTSLNGEPTNSWKLVCTKTKTDSTYDFAFYVVAANPTKYTETSFRIIHTKNCILDLTAINVYTYNEILESGVSVNATTYATTDELVNTIPVVTLASDDNFAEVVYNTAKSLGFSNLFIIQSLDANVTKSLTNAPPDFNTVFQAFCYTLYDGSKNSDTKSVTIEAHQENTVVFGSMLHESSSWTPSISWNSFQSKIDTVASNLTNEIAERKAQDTTITNELNAVKVPQQVNDVDYQSTGILKFTSLANSNRTFYLKIDNGEADTTKQTISIMPQNTTYVNFHSRIGSGTESNYTAQRNSSTSYTTISNISRGTSFLWWEADIANGDALEHIVCFSPSGYAAKIYSTGRFTVTAVTTTTSDTTELNPEQGSTELS